MPQFLSPRAVRLRGIRQPIWPQVDPTHPINKGLIGYWQLDGEGVLVPDYSGFGNNGVGTAVGLRDSHHGGNALSFNGTTSNVIIPSNAAITGANPRTFAAWFLMTNLVVSNTIFGYGANSANAQFSIYNDTGNAGAIYFSANSNDRKTTAGGLFAANTWAHIAITYNGGPLNITSSLLIYINGVSVATTLVSGSTGAAFNTSASAVHIGDDLINAGRVLTGAVEGARWYNRALDGIEIQQLYAEPYAGIFDAYESFAPVGILTPPLMGQIWLA
jgi:hypothetical protein